MTTSTQVATINDIRQCLTALPAADLAAAEAARTREPQLTKPPGSLGRLEHVAEWLSAWQGRHPPSLEQISVRVFAGNHGVVARGVSAYPPEVTAQMVGNFEAGGAAINQLCKAAGAELQVIALDLEQPTADFTQAPAMTEIEFLSAFNAGIESVPESCDLLCVGEMGIGNTSAAAAICHALYGGQAADWTGPGTGVSGSALDGKARIVAEAVQFHHIAPDDGLEVLRCLGGRELAAIAGAIVGARALRVPVLLDGYVASAAAATLSAASTGALDHCLAAHVSAEPAHGALLEKLGQRALLDFGMRLGEASGAALAIPLIRAACACHTGMATFAEAGVTDKD
jgi:nicotinate-nucleotide--dimethylbenzimidazole phosphoribosyltransferase